MSKREMRPISRLRASKSVMTVNEAVAADRKNFDEHPDEDEYIREFVPTEFGAAELPDTPFRISLINSCRCDTAR